MVHRRAPTTPPALFLVVRSLGRLAANKGRPQTQGLSVSALLLLQAWLCLSMLPIWPKEMLDKFFFDMLEWRFDRRLTYLVANRLVAAVAWAFLALGGPPWSLRSASSQALAGRRRLKPGLSRPPIPEAVLWAIAMQLLPRGRSQLAFICVRILDLYLRPLE